MRLPDPMSAYHTDTDQGKCQGPLEGKTDAHSPNEANCNQLIATHSHKSLLLATFMIPELRDILFIDIETVAFTDDYSSIDERLKTQWSRKANFFRRDGVLTDEQLFHLWKKDLGKEISVQRLYEISAAITSEYRQEGFVLSRAFTRPA